MALIRCPNCETLHDMDTALFGGVPRRVRCASCRTIWEASPESDKRKFEFQIPTIAPMPVLAPLAKDTPPAPEASMEEAAGSDSVPPDFDFDALPVDAPLGSEAVPAETAAAAFLSPPADVADAPSAPPVEAGLIDAQTATVAESVPAGPARKQHRSARHTGRAAAKAGSSARAVMMTATLCTIATLGLFRHEIVQFVPQTAGLYESVGLGVNRRGVDISEIQSQILREDDRETLEITGAITNLARNAQKIPVMRLAIRNAQGQEIYVWTASADQVEIASGEKTTFRRRLASPPAEAHSVMVRFVAKDDIVASIR